MEQFVVLFNIAVGISVVAMQVIIAGLIIAIIGCYKPVLIFIHAKKLQLVSWITIGALLGSLIYSNVIGFSACYLCWTQRIIMLITGLIATIGTVKKIAVKKIVRVLVPVIGLGTIVAIYHTLIQNGIGEGSSICQALGGISCVQLYVNQFGYITIPVMSLTVFVLILVITLIKRPRE